MRVFALLIALVAALLPGARASAAPDVVVTPVEFRVTNPLAPGQIFSVKGNLYRPAEAECTSVLLMLHGLSYGVFGWDFPVESDTYSVARALARRGYASVAVDQLGYGTSDKPNGHTLTVQSYAHMAFQMLNHLKVGNYIADDVVRFDRAGLMGHSAGTEISELAAGLYGNADVVIATGYTHFPSQAIVQEFITGDTVRAMQSDYEYFLENETKRTAFFYHPPAGSDPAVIAKDTELANLTPSGEILSIGNQPSRWTMGLITAPVLLLLADNDVLFPIGTGEAELELSLFASATDKTLAFAENAGHTFMLHPNAPETNDKVADWLDARQSSMPRCSS